MVAIAILKGVLMFLIHKDINKGGFLEGDTGAEFQKLNDCSHYPLL